MFMKSTNNKGAAMNTIKVRRGTAICEVAVDDLPIVRARRTDKLENFDKALLAMWQRIAEGGATVRLRSKPKRIKTGYVADVIVTKPMHVPTVYRAFAQTGGAGKLRLRKKFECRVNGENI